MTKTRGVWPNLGMTFNLMPMEGAKTIELKKDDILLYEGEDSHNMYWIQKGQLVVYRQKGTQQVQLGHVFEGELVGEMSFLDNFPRSASVKAITDCELVEIPRDKFEKYFETQPKWLLALLRTLLDRLRKANARIKV